MTSFNWLAKKNALRAVTYYENKNNINLKTKRWHIEHSECTFHFDELIEFIQSLDWRYNSSYKVLKLEVMYFDGVNLRRITEFCLFCGDKYLAHVSV